MSRTSRIPHPAGSRFVAVHQWAVHRFGLAGAAVLGVLDFWDRGQDLAEQPLGSRNRIVAALEGMVGRNLVDAALHDLLAAGVIHAHKTTTPGPRNIQTRINYGLDVLGLASILGDSGTPDFGTSGEYRNRKSQELPKSGPESGVPSNNREIEVEAAAPRARARGSADAAAATPAKRNCKTRCQRQSGIVTWTQDDLSAAEQIEQTHTPEQISAAVAAVSAKGKEPVPGLVAQAVARQQQASEASQRRAATEAAYRANLNAPASTTNDAAARERGRQILALRRRAPA